jgi:hypothetical protein
LKCPTWSFWGGVELGQLQGRPVPGGRWSPRQQWLKWLLEHSWYSSVYEAALLLLLLSLFHTESIVRIIACARNCCSVLRPVTICTCTVPKRLAFAIGMPYAPPPFPGMPGTPSLGTQVPTVRTGVLTLVVAAMELHRSQLQRQSMTKIDNCPPTLCSWPCACAYLGPNGPLHIWPRKVPPRWGRWPLSLHLN